VGELVDVLGAAGFADVRVTESFDPFRGSSKEKTARHFGVQGVNVAAVKPA
jgi:hypothetical protein